MSKGKIALFPRDKMYTMFRLFDDVQVVVGYASGPLVRGQWLMVGDDKFTVQWTDEESHMILVEEIPHA